MKHKFPQISQDIFLTDGGIETCLIFNDGFNLPYFSAFDLLKDEKGNEGLKNYYKRYLNIAKDFKTGFILETPTWRANPDWLKKTGYDDSSLPEIIRRSVKMMNDLKNEFSYGSTNFIISGCVGPRGDGYKPENMMSIEEAENYHLKQIKEFAKNSVDIITAITMNYVEEAIGVVRAANNVNVPAVISFTVETDGRLPTGQSLKDAIEEVDKSAGNKPLYYMINCAHPGHFINELINAKDENWVKRIKGVRANASKKSHKELDEAEELDIGNIEEFGLDHKNLKDLFSHINIFGGCCGTDERHVLEIAKQLK